MIFNLVVIAVIVVLLVLANALYVAGEFALVSSRKTRIVQQAEAGNPMAQRVLPVLEDRNKLDNYIAASQVGITLSSISLGIYGQRALSPLVEGWLGGLPLEQIPWLAGLLSGGFAATFVLLLLTTFQVVIGELVPKTLAIQYPERIALSTFVPMKISAEYVLKPLIVVLNGSGRLIMRLLGLDSHGEHTHVHSPEEIEILVGESHQGGLIDAEERQLLHNAFRIGELSAQDVMIPRTRMMAISVDTLAEEALTLAGKSTYTRIPVYESDIDHIIGFVHLKDLLRLVLTDDQADLSSIVRLTPHVPETAPVTEIWQRLNQEHAYLAIVFDEYGGTAGLITQEDLIEELFGELQDEFDDELALIKRQDQGRFVVRGDVQIDYLNDQLDISLPVDVAHSIGGLVLDELGRPPRVGDSLEIDGIQFIVETVHRRSVREVQLILPHQQASHDAPNDPRDLPPNTRESM